jgi:hypothetical protein
MSTLIEELEQAAQRAAAECLYAKEPRPGCSCPAAREAARLRKRIEHVKKLKAQARTACDHGGFDDGWGAGVHRVLEQLP